LPRAVPQHAIRSWSTLLRAGKESGENSGKGFPFLVTVSCYTGSLHLPKLQPNRVLSAISGMIHIPAELLLLSKKAQPASKSFFHSAAEKRH